MMKTQKPTLGGLFNRLFVMRGKNKDTSIERSFGWSLVESFPLSAAVFVLAFGTTSVLLLLLGLFSGILIWVLGLISVVVSVAVVSKNFPRELPGSLRERRTFGIIALMFVVAWVGLNSMYTSQNVFIYRDPAIYSATAEWLITNDSPNVPASDVFGADKDILSDSVAYRFSGSDESRLFSPFPHMYSALLGILGKIGGAAFMLHANVLFGGLAILSVYGLARFFVRPRFALLASSVIAVSLPMIYFSRETYSEPLALAGIFTGLSMTFIAQAVNRRSLWFIAGAIVATPTLVRIDTYIILAAYLVFSTALVLAAESRKRKSLINQLLFICGAILISIVGWLDVSQLSPEYYNDHSRQFIAQIIMIAIIFVTAAAFIFLFWRYEQLRRILSRHTRLISVIAVLATSLFLVFLMSRPLWLTARDGANNVFVEIIQRTEGEKIDGTRTYAEHTTYWLMWYLGPALVLLGFLGLVQSLRSLFVDKKYITYLPLFLTVGMASLLYLNRPSITPDQIWAARRFVPLIFPGLAIFGVIALQNLLEGVKIRKYFIAAIIMAILIPPLLVTYPFISTRTNVPELSQVRAICEKLPRHAAVLFVGQHAYNMSQTVRTYCEVPVERIASPSRDELAVASREATQKGFSPVVILLDSEASLLTSGSTPSIVSRIVYEELKRELNRPPRETVKYTRTVLLGSISDDGTVSKIR